MRKLLQRTRQDLGGFIQQDLDLLLLVSCSDNDVPIVLGLLREIEQEDDDNLYLLFADEFESIEQFAELTIERLRAEHCTTEEALRQEGGDPIPPMPEETGDAVSDR